MSILFRVIIILALANSATGLNGATPQLRTFNGWKVFEVITEGDNPSNGWRLPGILDGAGAYLADERELRIQVNHELANQATISEVALHVPSLKAAIRNMIRFNSLQGQTFVIGARRAYQRYTLDGGTTWRSNQGNFRRFCSSQSYSPRPRGFVDQLYITGEETGRNPVGRLVAIQSLSRDMYVLSGVTGDSGEGGNPGIPFDSFENAAWIDTKENNHVALVLSADYGSETVMLYIGKRGKGFNGESSDDVLARNGLAYGSWFYLKGSYPDLNQSRTGSFGTGRDGALSSSKMEDVDTSPSFPTRVVLGDQNSGVFVLDFSLNFQGNQFRVNQSSFSIKKIANHNPNNNLNGADNADWTAVTSLKGTSYPQGIIFMNEDTDTGEIWQMTPDGGNKVRIGESKTGGESTGILDLSELVGYAPGSIVLSNNFGSPEGGGNLPSAMHILINPKATETSPANAVAPIAAPRTPPTARPHPSPTARPIPAPTQRPLPSPSQRPVQPMPIPNSVRAPVASVPTVRPQPIPTIPIPGPTTTPLASAPVSTPISSPQPPLLVPASVAISIPSPTLPTVPFPESIWIDPSGPSSIFAVAVSSPTSSPDATNINNDDHSLAWFTPRRLVYLGGALFLVAVFALFLNLQCKRRQVAVQKRRADRTQVQSSAFSSEDLSFSSSSDIRSIVALGGVETFDVTEAEA